MGVLLEGTVELGSHGQNGDFFRIRRDFFKMAERLYDIAECLPGLSGSDKEWEGTDQAAILVTIGYDAAILAKCVPNLAICLFCKGLGG